jgi:phosphotransferase system enzyme I (PtsP)
MRTLDIGGDKVLPYFPVSEDNPFLGWRGIRITLDHPELFLVQVRAMLRASYRQDNLRIMLPMISSISEVEEATDLIKQAYQELCSEGLAITMPMIGAMIEVPSAIYLANALAQRVDFLSVGSNDLTQYLLAVDRNNARVANLYDALHPAVLHALLQAVNAVHAAGKSISICGEMAGDPIAVLVLLAMEFNALSMSSTAIPKIKRVIRHFTLQQAKELLADVLTMDNAAHIRQHLAQALRTAGLGALIGNAHATSH